MRDLKIKMAATWRMLSAHFFGAGIKADFLDPLYSFYNF